VPVGESGQSRASRFGDDDGSFGVVTAMPLVAGRPMFEDAGANRSRHSPAKVDTHKADRGPLLLTSGTEDHTVPLKVTKEVVAMYSKGSAQTDFHIFEGRGHSLTINNRWKDVADVALQWLAANGL
jgi:predicted esterase